MLEAGAQRAVALAILVSLCIAFPVSAQLPRDDAELEEWIEDYVTPQGHSNWFWGSLAFNWIYRFDVKVNNRCASPEQVMVLPDADLRQWVSVEPIHVVPAKTLTPINVMVKTGPPGDFESEKVRFMDARGAVHEYWTSLPIEGRLFVDAINEDSNCIGIPRVYNASGFLFNLPGDDFVISSCWTYWAAALRPPATWDCTDAFRQFALQYLGTLGDPEELLSSPEWSWLPTAAEIMAMSDIQLLEMKRRAEAQRLDTLSTGR